MSSSVRVANRGAMAVRATTFAWGTRTFVMGIVNATPDSFSGDGRIEPSDAIARGLALLDAGADLLDIGAESTRPGHTPIDASEERRRLLPVVRGLRDARPDTVLSIDTFKADVFATAFEHGGDLLNSIWGFDDALLACAVARDVPIVVMHNRRDTGAGDVVDEVLESLDRQAERAVRAGIAADRVIVDPGIGFGKTPDQNLALLASLDRFVALGFPTLVGTSRKSTIGALTGRDPGERTYGTAATVALAIAAGIDIVRVHDVAAMTDVVRVSDAIVRGWRPHTWLEKR